MVRAKPDRRRKRSSAPSSSEGASESSWSPSTLLLSAGFLLFMLLSISVDDGSIPASAVEQRLQQQKQQLRQQQGTGRRFLLNEEQEQVLDVGVKENVWRRQLRARKNNKRNKAEDAPDMKVDSGLQDYGLMEDGSSRPMRRMAVIPRYTDKHHFEECVGKSIDECQTMIDTFVTDNPEQFNNQTSLWLDIRKIRELTDDSYYKVVIRTNIDGDRAYGIFDDGIIYYPWPWRVGGQDRAIGPWDCEEGGVFMTPAECCSMIQADVADQDDNGNYLACFVEEPVGGPNNPEREDRAIVVTDGAGRVVRAPVAH